MSPSDERERPARVDAHLVCGGRFHDFDHARLRLLELLADHPDVRTTVAGDYRDLDRLAECQVLVSYTCDVRPDDDQQRAHRAWVEAGGRWLALHGTNAALDFTPDGVVSPRCFPLWADTLGSQFVAHPPIAPYTVTPVGDHPLVDGLDPFEVSDELYLSEHADVDALVPLLETRWSGTAKGFVESEWDDDDRRLVAYLRPLGEGAVCYITLGHCRGHHDMRPLTSWYPTVERGAWEVPTFVELLRRGIRWAAKEEAPVAV